MAVTTGSTTGTTSSNKTSSNPSGGGPGGGALSAPNRTAPSSGTGGQGGNTKSGSSSTASKASPSQSSAPGKTDKETPAPTSGPGKTDKVGTSEVNKKPGLAGIQGAAQQAAFDKQKDLYTQAGGASASMRQAQMDATRPTNSAKVTDPSRGLTPGAPGKTDKQASPDVARPTGGLTRGSGTATPWGGTMSTPGKTSNLSKQPESNLLDKTNKQPSPSVARPTNGSLTRGSGTDTAWGGGPTTPQTSAPGKTDKGLTQPSYDVNKSFSENWFKGTTTGKVLDALSGGRLSKGAESLPGEYKRSTSGTQTAWGGDYTAPTSTPGKTDKQPSPSVARPTTETFIDSLGVRPRGLTVEGSILGNQPTSPSASQAAAMDPISYYGPRVGTTPATPGNRPMTGSDALASMEDTVRRAQQGTLLGNYAAPQPKIADRVPAEMPSQGLGPDPRLAQMQEQFGRIAAGRGQMGKVASGVSVQPTSASPPSTTQNVNPMYRDPMAQADAVRKSVALAMGQAPRAPQEINVPGYPEQVAPSQAGTGNIFNRSARDLIDAVNIASDKLRGVGDIAQQSPVAPASSRTVSPSQEGDYPPDENFMQDAGQPQDLGELKNRGQYEYDRAKDGLRSLAGRLYDAITRGDISGYTPETNDKAAVRRPQPKPSLRLTKNDHQAVARLIALLKAMEQEQSASQQQADLVNSTFQ